MRYIVLPALFAALATGSAVADSRFVAAADAGASVGGMQYAQNTVASLGESDLRRLVFYSERTMGSLSEIVDASESGEFDQLSRLIEGLRNNISRLTDAGERSGVPQELVTNFFVQNVHESFGPGYLDKVGSAAGGLDIPTLFRNVATISHSNAATLNDNSQFLSALEDASAGLSLGATPGQPQILEIVADEGPLVRENASADERAVVQRIVAKNDKWTITVIQGDSLALIASSIYGDSLSYNVIFQANIDILENPNTLNIGDILKLPKP